MKTLKEDVMEALAHHLGVEALAFGDEGTLLFAVEGVGTYSLEEENKDWILSFFKSAPHRDKKWYIRLLEHCLPDQLPFEASIGLLPDHQLWIGTRLPQDQLNLQDLLQRFEDLRLLSDNLAHMG